MNIFNKILKSLLILPLFFCCFLKGDALYVKFALEEKTIFGDTLQNSTFTGLLKSDLDLSILRDLKDGKLNTNTDENYKHLTDFVDQASAFIAKPEIEQNLPALKENFSKWKTSSPESKHIVNYFKTLESIRELKTGSKDSKEVLLNSVTTLIDPNWIITAYHTFEIGIQNKELLKDTLIGDPSSMIDEAYKHPNLDLVLLHLKAPLFKLKPIERYRGIYTGQDCYIYSDLFNNDKGETLLPDGQTTKDVALGHHFSLIAICNLISGSKPVVNIKLKDDPPFTFQTFDGDNGGPIFIKVRSTGVPEKDYQLIGINNVNDVINVSDSSVNTWIDNIIISKAIGTSQPTTKF